MAITGIAPPNPDEYSPLHAEYVAAVGSRDPLELLETQPSVVTALLGAISEELAQHRYAPGKWSVKQVLGHISDAERVFSYRLFRISRGDATPLSGFDERAYVAAGGFDHRPVSALVADFETIRRDTLRLVKSLSSEAWSRRGVANGHPVSTRALLFILPGHVEHHLAILTDRYRIGPVDEVVPLPD